MITDPDFFKLPVVLGTCPKCGARDQMRQIPKHRNGVYGRFCFVCKETNYKDEWRRPSGNMSYEEFKGI